MLSEYLNEETVMFAENLPGWRDAIELVATPLLEQGLIKRDYVDAMLNSIAAGGTYIDLGYGIALAHARPEAGVIATGLSALRVTPDVLLNDEESHPIKLFFCLAAGDNQSHLETLRALGQLLSNPEERDTLLAAKNPAKFLAVLNKGVEKVD